MPFKAYAAAGFGAELLPILPPDAAISPASPAAENLEKSRGKVPGRLSKSGWFGFKDWPNHEATAQDHARWSSWKAGVGLQGRKFPGLDIDVDDEGIADAIADEAISTLGLAPSRSRGGGRRLLVYSGSGIAKRRLAFSILCGPDDVASEHLRVPETGGDAEGQHLVDQRRTYAVELLGIGQQYVCEGMHPSGQRYVWNDGLSPAELGVETLAVIDADDVEAFFAWLASYVVSIGGEIVSNSGGGGVTQRDGVYQAGLRAPSLAAAKAALHAIDPNTLDYDEWTNVMTAFKAATEGV